LGAVVAVGVASDQDPVSEAQTGSMFADATSDERACQIGSKRMTNGEVLDFEGDPSAREKLVSAMHEATSGVGSVAEAEAVLEEWLTGCQLHDWTVEVSIAPSASSATTAMEGIFVAFGRKAVTIYGHEDVGA
jgi:hypothetical protein